MVSEKRLMKWTKDRLRMSPQFLENKHGFAIECQLLLTQGPPSPLLTLANGKILVQCGPVLPLSWQIGSVPGQLLIALNSYN